MPWRKKKKPPPGPATCKHKYRKVGTVTKNGVTYTIEACFKCHDRRIS